MNKLTSDRKFWPTLLLTIVTLGFYQWYLIYAFAKETNIACKEDGKKTPSLTTHVLLSIITLGIYAIVWKCMWIKRCNSYLRQNGKPEGLRISTYLLMVLGCPLFYIIYSFGFYVAVTKSQDMMNLNSSLFLIARIFAFAQLILWLLCWIIVIYKQLYLQNSVNNLYNENIIETIESANNEIPPTVKCNRTIATIFTTLILISTSLIHLALMSAIDIDDFCYLLPVLVVLFCIPVLISLLKISSNKATQHALIIIVSTIIVQHLCYLVSFLMNTMRVHFIIYHYLPVLYYICITYAVSIILRSNIFKKDSIKKTWIALLPFFWLNGYNPMFEYSFAPFFSIIFIPACFCAIYSSAFCGCSTKEESTTTDSYNVINRYTIASVIVLCIIYIIPIVTQTIFNIIAH